MTAVPATVVIHHLDGDDVWIGNRVELQLPVEPGVPYMGSVVLRGRSEEKWFTCRHLHQDGEQWRGQVFSPLGSAGPGILIRPTVPDDAVTSITMSGLGRYPQPLDVLAYLHADNEGIFTLPRLYSLADDDGLVTRLLLTSGAGLHIRHHGEWTLLVDDDDIDGYTVRELADEAFGLFEHSRGRVMDAYLPGHPNPTPLGSMAGGAR